MTTAAFAPQGEPRLAQPTMPTDHTAKPAAAVSVEPVTEMTATAKPPAMMIRPSNAGVPLCVLS